MSRLDTYAHLLSIKVTSVMGCLPLHNMVQLAAHAAEEEADIQQERVTFAWHTHDSITKEYVHELTSYAQLLKEAA